MEERYKQKDEESFVSGKVDLESYFNEFGKLFADAFASSTKTSAGQLAKASAEETSAVDQWTRSLFKGKAASGVAGFRCMSEPVPSNVSNLRSLRHLVKRTEETTKELKKKLSFTGEVSLPDAVFEGRDAFQKRIDLVPGGYYALTVRVYLPVQHSKYTVASRARELQVSQELFCLSSGGLDLLRDRIACPSDFQPVDGDISDDLARTASARTGEVHRSAMFYFCNDFYVDLRHWNNEDYSAPIIDWGRGEGYQFGDVHRMEYSTMSDLKPLRLGYPYLYLHQATCEHLVIVTDARLLHPTDPLDSTKYPFLIGFSTFNCRYCFACHAQVARYVVVGSDRLPQDVAYMCAACLESFNYVGGRKIGRFQVYGYVDRSALL